MKLIQRLNHKKRGFTLIELIMTIVVAAIVAVPLSLLLSQQIQSVFQSEDLTIMRQLARFEIEKVSNMNYANISSDSFSNYEGYNYDLIRTVIYAQGTAENPESLKEITVEVSKSGSTEVLTSLVTYIAKNVSYGL